MTRRESDQDTIAAIATAVGEGGVGIVRLSGRESLAIAEKIFVSGSKKLVADQKGFTAQYGHVIAKSSVLGGSRIIDEAILLVMRAPKSYTAQDVVEIQVHGGSIVLQEVLALAVQEGARLAAGGEFTKRAFLNGRIDLLQAEAVLDLIQAKTEKSRQWASAQLEGELSKKIAEMKKTLLEILVFLEASIDFPEDDLELGEYSGIENRIFEIKTKIQSLLRSSELGLLAKRGARVVLWGRPNAGKSSLMNRLAHHDRVIVTPIPGTTRDVVEEEIQLEGFPVRLFDTAGIQETTHPIEKEGVFRSRLAAAGSDLVLFVLDAGAELDAEDIALYKEIESKPKMIVLNKSDLPKKISQSLLENAGFDSAVIETSCQKAMGIVNLEKKILEWLGLGKAQDAGESVISSVRQRDVLQKMLEAVVSAQDACRDRLSPELVAVDVRLSLDCLGELLGEIVNDEMLDVLFGKFCIGK